MRFSFFLKYIPQFQCYFIYPAKSCYRHFWSHCLPANSARLPRLKVLWILNISQSAVSEHWAATHLPQSQEMPLKDISKEEQSNLFLSGVPYKDPVKLTNADRSKFNSSIRFRLCSALTRSDSEKTKKKLLCHPPSYLPTHLHTLI